MTTCESLTYGTAVIVRRTSIVRTAVPPAKSLVVMPGPSGKQRNVMVAVSGPDCAVSLKPALSAVTFTSATGLPE